MTLNHQSNPKTFTTHLSTFSQHLKQTGDINRNEANTNINNNNNHSGDDHNLNRQTSAMSPFDEQEEWAKISEIMESFGSGIARESVFVHDIENEFQKRLGLSKAGEATKLSTPIEEVCENLTPLKRWLNDINLEHLEEYFLENGYDNPDYINGLISNENDLEIIGIPVRDRIVLLNEIMKLPKPHTLIEANSNSKLNNNQLPSPTVDEWLASIELEDYIEVFKKHLYIDMEKIFKVWEIELQAVLEINKIGHRKRILHSLIGKRIEPPNIEEINEESSSILDILLQNNKHENNNDVVNAPVVEQKLIKSSTSSSRHRKNRAPPPPPPKESNLEIRSPSELLLSNQGSLQAQWKHSASALVSGSIKYEVFYLGSTIIKELRGTESTRKSIQKLKKGTFISSSSPSHSTLVQSFKRPVCIAISHMGVQFIDIDSQGVICEHAIKNIDCACQDAEDLSHFAYITKDFENNIYYCHVFSADSMELATEIILTVGQAFEVAYQLVLRETSSTTPSSNCGKRPMSLTSSTSMSDHG